MQGDNFIDAAVQLPNDSNGSWRTLLFQGDSALTLNWDAGLSKLVKITDIYKCWAELAGTTYAQGVDAAVQLPNEKSGSWRTLLFKGANCLDLSWDGGIYYDDSITGYGAATGLKWPQLSPTIFANGVDTAVQLPTESSGSWRTLLFKYYPQADNDYDQYVDLSWNGGIYDMGSINNYQKRWVDVPRRPYGKEFVALQLPSNDHGSWRTVLFNGANCYQFNWDSSSDDYTGPITGFGKTKYGDYWKAAYNLLTGS